MGSERVQARHQGVALLPPFPLGNGVGSALHLHRRPGRPLTRWDDRFRSFAACNFGLILLKQQICRPLQASTYKALRMYKPNRANTQARPQSPCPYRVVVH